ncbi:possible Zn-binding dehydrogenase (plasmid) [Rhodococcus jostii RHA1]|uniref:Possible Zn-binding dehydrogenase n=1 Tax=Rhodococcus jostii (strain RHA1) TaxID=101510 RepID=Q0RW54_RHOJR|nr:Zn-binding dehydrogenase [Rhodococcus jostii]ABH00482.1 possible Zn-binding dehydrogenase [Rhodococcus jostii RHA1]
MHTARRYGPRDLRLSDIAVLAVADGTVKVEIAWAGICGSDLSAFATNPNPPDVPGGQAAEVKVLVRPDAR